MKIKFLIPLVLLSALVVAGCGGDDSASSGAAGNSTDRAFVADMIPHHVSAVDMATIAQERGESEFVKSLADDIIESQTAEISTMKEQDAELAEADVEVGELGMDHSAMGMEDVSSLDTATPFDKAFVDMMIPHHEGAVEMANIELEEGADPELKELAEQIISEQEREISEMEDFLAS